MAARLPASAREICDTPPIKREAGLAQRGQRQNAHITHAEAGGFTSQRTQRCHYASYQRLPDKILFKEVLIIAKSTAAVYMRP